jgi:thioredoxin reductase (NADPH)
MSDLLIIGAGPIGLAAGIEAKRAGLQFQILEAGTICQSLVEYPLACASTRPPTS